MAKAKKSKAKKSKSKKAKKPVRRAKAATKARVKKGKKKAPAKKAAPAARKPARKAAKKAPAKKRNQIVGEGDYAASRAFLKDQAGFVKRNQSKIAGMGEAAEKALEGPEGDSLRAAEEEAKNHAKSEGA